MSADRQENETSLPFVDTGIDNSQAVNGAKRRLGGKVVLIPLFMLTLFTGAVIGMYFQPPGLRAFFNATGLEPGAGTDTPIAVAIEQVTAQERVAVVSGGDVVALGRIIPLGDVISVAPPSGAGDARIAEVRVAVGDVVAEGDILAVLDNLPQLQAALASAQAAVSVREATLAQVRVSNRASLEEARASLERAEATAQAALAERERATALLERGVITRAEFDRAQAASTEAARDVERAIATLSRYETGSETVQADIAVAEANLQAARADLASATQNFWRAPMSARPNMAPCWTSMAAPENARQAMVSSTLATPRR